MTWNFYTISFVHNSNYDQNIIDIKRLFFFNFWLIFDLIPENLIQSQKYFAYKIYKKIWKSDHKNLFYSHFKTFDEISFLHQYRVQLFLHNFENNHFIVFKFSIQLYLCTILQKHFQKVSFNFRLFITIIRVWGFSFIKNLILGFLTWKFNTLSDVLCTIFLKIKILLTQNFLEFREAITDNYTEASLRIVFYRMQSLHSNWI